MTAAISRVQSFGGDDELAKRVRRARADDRLLQLRLPAADVTCLNWTFDLLEGSMGIGSSFGAQIQRVQEGRHYVADVDCFFGECCEVEDDAVCTWHDLLSVARAWSSDAGGAPLKSSQLRTWLEERGTIREKSKGRIKLRGVRVKPWVGGAALPPLSDRVAPQTMHVGSVAQSCKADDLPVEGWACWSSDTTIASLLHSGEKVRASSPRAIRACREALLAMPTAHAVTLYRMYGADTSREFRKRYSDLLDLAPLAEDTPMVLAHAEKLTGEARSTEHFAHFARALEDAERMPARVAEYGRLREEWQKSEHDETRASRNPRKLFGGPRAPGRTKTFDDVDRHTRDSRLAVTPREALSDLLESRPLDSKPRNAIAKEIREQAGRMLVAASAAYRKARERA
jgi:hypothetical protein